jgi:FkbM family methyltransferase
VKLINWQTANYLQDLADIGGQMASPHGNLPPISTKPVIGPLVNALRGLLWRLIGMPEILGARNHRLMEIFARMESRRPKGAYQHPEHNFYFREGTKDYEIFHAVFVKNEYRLPEAFRPEDVIIDIGMHIGSFSLAALTRGAGRVYGYEADRENYEVAARNLEFFRDRARIHHQAVWRSDRRGDALFAATHHDANTGGKCILVPSAGEKLDVIAFDDVIDAATNDGRDRVRLVKIDCEGCEYPILMTSRRLHLIDSIHGEYHHWCESADVIPEVARVPGVERFDIRVLVDWLKQAGFRVTVPPPADPHLGFFFATRS